MGLDLMRVPGIKGSVAATVYNASKIAKRSSYDIKREKEIAREIAKLRATPPEPYHIMPELTFIGLWKWF